MSPSTSLSSGRSEDTHAPLDGQVVSTPPQGARLPTPPKRSMKWGSLRRSWFRYAEIGASSPRSPTLASTRASEPQSSSRRSADQDSCCDARAGCLSCPTRHLTTGQSSAGAAASAAAGLNHSSQGQPRTPHRTREVRVEQDCRYDQVLKHLERQFPTDENSRTCVRLQRHIAIRPALMADRRRYIRPTIRHCETSRPTTDPEQLRTHH